MKNKLFANRRAFALVLVLIAIVLSTTMAVFFLSSVGRERLGVSLYSTGGEVRHLAGMTVSRVIGQITAATKEGTATAPVSWASQPGMIRTYDNTGAPKTVYKLYSWDNSTQAGGTFNPSASNQVPASTWRNDTAHYVDINQKVSDVYPIVDPRAEGLVEGFSVNEGNPIVGGPNLENAPMPVKWLYVLEDGQMVAPPATESGTTATVAGATPNNPIIGRVAYWTDDETSKVNVNTASEGSFWDVPRSGSRDDLQFAGNPPVSNEFQRTPGHPSMTSLSAILPELVPSLSSTAADPTKSRWLGNYTAELKAVHDLTPRIDGGGLIGGVWRGSQAGKLPVQTYSTNYPPTWTALQAMTLPQQIELDTDRLYVSADELWFRQPRTADAGERFKQDGFVGPGLVPANLQERLFFLTSNSRAPETTLFETPRISLWPVTWRNRSSYFASGQRTAAFVPTSSQNPNTTAMKDIDPNWTTSQERLIAFCGMLNVGAPPRAGKSFGEDRYFFQRQNPDSSTFDYTQITRNSELVDYLARQTNANIPGFSGGSLQNKWTDVKASDWVALNTFDYSRSLINQYTAPNFNEGIRYSYTGTVFRYGRINFVPKSTGGVNEINARTVVPLEVTRNGNKFNTAGAYPILEEVALVFYAAARREPQIKNPPPALQANNPAHPTYPEWRNPFNWNFLINPGPSFGGTSDASVPIASQTTVMRGVMLFDFSGIEPGTDTRPVFWMKVSGSSFGVNGSPINLPSASGRAIRVDLNSKTTMNSRFGFLFHEGKPKIFTNSSGNQPHLYPLVSNDINMNPDNVEFDFSGSRITVQIYSVDPTNIDVDTTSDSNRLIYTKEINFDWNDRFPIPLAPRWSRASAFNNGSQLPGGTTQKNSSPSPFTPIESNFNTPAADFRWRPNPEFQAISAPAAFIVGKETRTTNWAWAEYAPSLGGQASSGVSTLQDVRTTQAISTVPNGITTYYYRTSNQPTDLSQSGGGTDPDDARETNVELRKNFSTNFRKRVAAINTRNNTNPRGIFCVEGVTANAQFPNPDDYKDSNPASSTTTRDLFFVSTEDPLQPANPLLTPYDTVLSMINVSSSSALDRDTRISRMADNDNFRRANQVFTGNPSTIIASQFPRRTRNAQYHQFNIPGSWPNITGYHNLLVTSETKAFGRARGLDSSADFGRAELGAFNLLPVNKDWTSMPGRFADGSWLVRPDQEYEQLVGDTADQVYVPYYPRDTYGSSIGASQVGSAAANVSYFSPNRQVPSPVILGALTTSTTTGFQTLAFAPNPAAGASHPGLPTTFFGVGDHLYLDFLWMPVAEPYPISDQLSTAGKINLNYQIMPFSFIQRKTALHALMKNTWMTAIPSNDDDVIGGYKSHAIMRGKPGPDGIRTRFAIDIPETLKGFDEVFGSGEIFRSGTQICQMFLVPKLPASSVTLANVRDLSSGYWSQNKITADNSREQPYNYLYSRVTTKSNTYTVHWRAQVLKKSPTTGAGIWDETRDRVASELRGSTLIERYIDPNATDIPDYATDASALPLSHFYRWRVVAENYFQP
jgi:hypothetical protein